MQESDREESLHVEESWRTQLEYLELALSEVTKAIGALRDTLERSETETATPPPVHVVGNEEAGTQSAEADRVTKAVGAVKQTADAAAEAEDAPPPSDFKNVWERLQRVRKERSGDAPPAPDDVDDAVTDGSTRAEAISVADPDDDTADGAGADSRPTNFQNVWERLQREREERSEDEADESPAHDDVGDAVADDGNDVDGAIIEPTSAGEQTVDAAGGAARPGNFQNVWERLQREREERSAAPMEEVADVRGLSNLPQSYRITIEDRDGTPVDLVPVHRALLAFAPADDVSLVNFANGTAIISLRTTEKLDLDELSSVISAATTRECEVIEQAQGKLFLRLSGEEDAGQDSDG